MAKRKQTDMVQGFDALRAARQAQEEGRVKEPDPAPQSDTDKDAPTGAPKVASRIGKTVMPSRTEIVCHACDHSFEIVGRSATTVCPSCRQKLDINDVEINEAWEDELITSGRVSLGPEGLIKGGVLVANQLVVKGKVASGDIRATCTLEVHPGSQVDLAAVSTRDLTLAENGSLNFPRAASHFRNVTLYGNGEGHLELDGCLTVKSTGCFSGSVLSAGLCVEEGGGLCAAMRVDPSMAETADDERKLA